ncbi:MAG TPA: response regulator [Polyangiaceae bacterium]|jgi:DNA-binding response OmpR family regulator|nr:response regulator [Polyangiaceae bacterium]
MGLGVTGRILVIDDDVKVQSVVKRAAEAAGFEVAQAFDGLPGLALAALEKFALILLDINMPAMDGRDVLKRLKENPTTADIPVLVYSGRDSQSDRLVALELGAEDFIDKPFEPSALIRKIGYLIDRKARERAPRK